MHAFIQKTFGGLPARHYVRHFLYGLIFPVGFMLLSSQSRDTALGPDLYGWLVISTLLYPYARFLYESILRYLVGANSVFPDSSFMLGARLFTMLMCWTGAILIAPLGLACLYVHHSRQMVD